MASLSARPDGDRMSPPRDRRALGAVLAAVIVVAVIVAAAAAAASVALYFSYHPEVQVTQTYSYSNFTALSVGSALKVEVTQSSAYGVSITGDQRTLDQIEVSQNGDILTIAARPGMTTDFHGAQVRITMPRLGSVSLSGATSGTAQGFDGGDGPLAVTLTGASSLEMTSVRAGNVTLDVSGASSFTATGSANVLVSTVSGASDLNLMGLTVEDTSMNLGGASHAAIDVNGRLDASVSGASSLQYRGSPTLGDITTSGASSVTKG